VLGAADNEGDVPAAALAPGAAVPAAGAGSSLLIAAVLARPLSVPVIKRVTEPARRQNASKCHEQGSDKHCPQDHRGSHDPKSKLRRVGRLGLIYTLCRSMWMHEFHVVAESKKNARV
jgi:hypothetical protein